MQAHSTLDPHHSTKTAAHGCIMLVMHYVLGQAGWRRQCCEGQVTYRCRNGRMTPSQQGKGEQIIRGRREANRQVSVSTSFGMGCMKKRLSGRGLRPRDSEHGTGPGGPADTMLNSTVATTNMAVTALLRQQPSSPPKRARKQSSSATYYSLTWYWSPNVIP